jgi:hypothetical protein
MDPGKFYTSISNALEKLAPTPTGGAMIAPAGKTSFGPISYVDKNNELKTDGELVVSIDLSNYTDANIRSVMIKAAASSFQNSATGSNCFQANWTDTDPKDHSAFHENGVFCNAANFAAINYVGFNPLYIIIICQIITFIVF